MGGGTHTCLDIRFVSFLTPGHAHFHTCSLAHAPRAHHHCRQRLAVRRGIDVGEHVGGAVGGAGGGGEGLPKVLRPVEVV